MASLSSLRFTGVWVIIAIGIAFPLSGHASELLSVDDFESRTLSSALDALLESEEKVDGGAIETGKTAASKSHENVGARAAANARIVNGLRTVSFPAVGSILKGRDAGQVRQWCTGTLIGSRHVVTAAHCILIDSDDPSTTQEYPDPAPYQLFFQNAGLFKVEKIYWQKNNYQFPNADIAVLRLKNPVRSIRPAALSLNEEPRTGTRASILGFGRTGGGNYDYGIKRIGSVRLSPCTGTGYNDVDLLCWEYVASVAEPGQNSNTCNADSGGPMMWAISPMRMVLAGVTSGGTRRDCLSADRSYDVSVFAHAHWIKSVVGADLGKAADVPPIVGEDGTTVLADDGRLTDEDTKSSWTFRVAEEAREVLVAFNAEDDGQYSNDFDLEVSFVEDGGLRQSLCKVTNQSQFGACEFSDPQQGVWEATLSRKLGQGFYQIVVTQFHWQGPTSPKTAVPLHNSNSGANQY
ncbi:MAG: trypsin-like serine protease [Halopseudomonas sp.]